MRKSDMNAVLVADGQYRVEARAAKDRAIERAWRAVIDAQNNG